MVYEDEDEDEEEDDEEEEIVVVPRHRRKRVIVEEDDQDDEGRGEWVRVRRPMRRAKAKASSQITEIFRSRRR